MLISFRETQKGPKPLIMGGVSVLLLLLVFSAAQNMGVSDFMLGEIFHIVRLLSILVFMLLVFFYAGFFDEDDESEKAVHNWYNNNNLLLIVIFALVMMAHPLAGAKLFLRKTRTRFIHQKSVIFS